MAKECIAIRKQQIIDTISAMPEDEFENMDVLLERIMVFEKIEKAEQNIIDNKVYTTEEARQKLAHWFQ